MCKCISDPSYAREIGFGFRPEDSKSMSNLCFAWKLCKAACSAANSSYSSFASMPTNLVNRAASMACSSAVKAIKALVRSSVGLSSAVGRQSKCHNSPGLWPELALGPMSCFNPANACSRGLFLREVICRCLPRRKPSAGLRHWLRRSWRAASTFQGCSAEAANVKSKGTIPSLVGAGTTSPSAIRPARASSIASLARARTSASDSAKIVTSGRSGR
jgi:hypothetical protein